jgi:hypothetical protein
MHTTYNYFFRITGFMFVKMEGCFGQKLKMGLHLDEVGGPKLS